MGGNFPGETFLESENMECFETLENIDFIFKKINYYGLLL